MKKQSTNTFVIYNVNDTQLELSLSAGTNLIR